MKSAALSTRTQDGAPYGGEAGGMTTAPASPSPPSGRPHPVADVLVTLVPLALDALAALVGVSGG